MHFVPPLRSVPVFRAQASDDVEVALDQRAARLDHETARRMPHEGLERAPCETQSPLDSLVRVGRARHENRRVGQSATVRELRQFPL
jgi:hypothetical protein